VIHKRGVTLTPSSNVLEATTGFSTMPQLLQRCPTIICNMRPQVLRLFGDTLPWLGCSAVSMGQLTTSKLLKPAAGLYHSPNPWHLKDLFYKPFCLAPSAPLATFPTTGSPISML